MKNFKITKYLVISLFIVIGCVTSSKAQYPFEKYKAIKYKRVAFKKSYNKDKSEIYCTAKLPGISNSKSKYSLMIKGKNEQFPDNMYIYIKKDGKIIQKLVDKGGFSLWGFDPGYGYLADINSDSLIDVKFSIGSSGNGIAGANRERIFLFQNKEGKFSLMTYGDCEVINDEKDDNFDYWPERDFNNDGKYEFVTCSLIRYKEHNYWAFDVFEYNNGNLVSADDKYGYPIMIQYLNRKNYEVTKRISAKKMKEFKLEKPEGLRYPMK